LFPRKSHSEHDDQVQTAIFDNNDIERSNSYDRSSFLRPTQDPDHGSGAFIEVGLASIPENGSDHRPDSLRRLLRVKGVEFQAMATINGTEIRVVLGFRSEH
jgi:hypothetical protein